MLPSKAIQAIGMCEGSMGSLVEVPLIKIPHISSHDKQRKKEKKNKSLSIYLNSKRRYEMSDVELVIIQPFKKPFYVRSTAPS